MSSATLPQLLAEFSGRRTAGAALVETLTATDLGRGGDHPEVGFLTVNDLLHEWIHHDANHLRQMLANVQTYTWPQMGNAQRFSAPDTRSQRGRMTGSRPEFSAVRR